MYDEIADRSCLAPKGKHHEFPLPRAAILLAALVVVLPSHAQPPLPPPTEKSGQPEIAPPPKEKSQPGVQVLDKGPIHEAFAQPGADIRGKGIAAPKAPPPPIPELPPDTKPDGENVKWVSGYWMWDGERNDFIWVSGFWRNIPPGRDWQAGEWRKSTDGTYAYSPGFWRPSNMNSWRVDLPQPPKTVENGPNVPAGDPNAMWVQGSWQFRDGQYVWRPGYWAHSNGNMVWQPGQYVVTPSGYTYVPGYWDYPLENRGLLYAPAQFSQPLWQNPGWAYTPQYALGGYGNGWGSGGLFDSLWMDPWYNNYYYGGYGGYPWGYGFGFGYPFWGFGFGFPFFGFGFNHFNHFHNGFHPWFHQNNAFHNTLWNHYAWMNRNNANWARNAQNSFAGRSMGVTNAGATHPMQPGVSGAVNAAVRSTASNVSGQPIHAGNTALVQPANQAMRSLSTANATRAGSVGASGLGTGGNALSAAHGITSPGGPVHAGASLTPGLGGSGMNIAPRGGTSMPSIGQISPGMSGNPGVHIAPGNVGANAMTHPGFTQSGAQFHTGNPGVYSMPGASGFRSMPSTSSMPSFHASPSFGGARGGFSGGFSGGRGGGSMGGGGHGGGGHR